MGFVVLNEEKVRIMYCSKCGKEIVDDSKFCYSCGSKTSNVKNTVGSSLPSNIINTTKSSDERIEIKNDRRNDESLSSQDTQRDLEDTERLEKYLKKKKEKEKTKWGWGWVILVIIFTQSYGYKGELHKKQLMRYDNIYTGGIELFGFIVMLIVYFWLRKYMFRYYDDYKPSLISGIISIFVSVFLIEFLCQLFSRL